MNSQFTMFMIETSMPVRVKNGGGAEAERRGDLGERAEVGAVQVAPHQRGDDAGHGVRHEDAQPDELRQPQHAAVEREREEQRQAEHDRHLDDRKMPIRPNAAEEQRIGEGPGVVVEPGEDVAADQLLLNSDR